MRGLHKKQAKKKKGFRMQYLKLHLQGFVQHYSCQSNLVTAPSSTYYKTEKHPTKKAVIGMIGAAMGLPRKSDGLQRLNDSLDIKYRTLKQGSVLADFQTAQPLRDDEPFPIANGKTKKDGKIIKTVEYLQDYRFEVYVGGEADLLDKIYSAFQNPYYNPYLGKKSCFPTRPFITDRQLVSLEDMKNVYDCT